MNQINNYTFVPLVSQNLNLSWTFPQTSDYIIAVIIDVTAQKFEGNFLSLTLPSAREGFNVSFFIRNISGGSATPENNSFYLVNYAGDNILGDDVPIIPGDLYYVYLTNLDFAEGNWKFVKMTNGTNSLNNFTIASNNNSLTITGGNVSSSGQTIDISLTDQLLAILNLTQSGYIAVDPNLGSYFTRNIIGDGLNINVTNGDGISDNTQISLNNQIAVDSLNTGAFNISGNTIEMTPGFNMNLATSGLGKVIINGVTTDTSGNLSIPSDLTVTGNIFAPNTMIGGVSFYETTASPGTSTQIIIQGKSGIVNNVEGVNGIYTVTFNSALANSNYSVFLSLQLSPSSATPLLTVYSTSLTTLSVIIYARDQIGNILPITEGVSVAIFQSGNQ